MSSSEAKRSSDRWLSGLVVFLIAIVLVACYLGWTAISRQARATCYQLRSIEQTYDRELELSTTADQKDERAAHAKSATGLLVYATGLRAIVPGCPHPPPRKEH